MLPKPCDCCQRAFFTGAREQCPGIRAAHEALMGAQYKDQASGYVISQKSPTFTASEHKIHTLVVTTCKKTTSARVLLSMPQVSQREKTPMSDSRPRTSAYLAIPVTLASMFAYATGSVAYAQDQQETLARLVKVEQQLERLQQQMRQRAIVRWRPSGAEREAGAAEAEFAWASRERLWNSH
jgi:hypothetical protein